VSHDVTGKAAFPSPVRANRRARRSRRWVPSAVLAGTVGVVAPLAMMTSPATAGAATVPTVTGYTLINWAGGVFGFGGAPAIGGTIGESNAPVVGIAPDSTGKGYWVATANGGVYSVGDAKFYGSAGNLALKAPIVGIVPTLDGAGYYLVASDGGVFAFGTSRYLGSEGGIPLNKPVVGITPTPTGNGYRLDASDGGVFDFGDASFQGSTGGLTLNQPIVGASESPTGEGYWLFASDGGVFSFNAPFLGAVPGLTVSLGAPIIGGSSPVEPSK
jgi:hypothetical protein